MSALRAHQLRGCALFALVTCACTGPVTHQARRRGEPTGQAGGALPQRNRRARPASLQLTTASLVPASSVMKAYETWAPAADGLDAWLGRLLSVEAQPQVLDLPKPARRSRSDPRDEIDEVWGLLQQLLGRQRAGAAWSLLTIRWAVRRGRACSMSCRGLQVPASSMSVCIEGRRKRGNWRCISTA